MRKVLSLMAVMVAAVVMSGCSAGDPSSGGGDVRHPETYGAVSDVNYNNVVGIPYNADGFKSVTDSEGMWLDSRVKVLTLDLSNVDGPLLLMGMPKASYTCSNSGMSGVVVDDNNGRMFDFVRGDTCTFTKI